MKKQKAPWSDFKGTDIYDGDNIIHPSGEKGIVKFYPGSTFKKDQWKVSYDDGSESLLCLQIGDKGQAFVKNSMTPKELKGFRMTPTELKDLRDSFDFTQKEMADILGIHPNALQRMEYGSSPIPKYIRHYALCLSTLNENKLFRKHIAMLGVEVNEEDYKL